jgi:Holliday junction DNA helicase RuvA
MIGRLMGQIVSKEERSLILDVSGVGYVVFVAPQVLADTDEGKRLSLWTHLAVKDDALDLYGFAAQEELRLFRLLISISGIGPKSALGVLALADTGTILRAIGTGDSSYLTKVAGIGKKLAEKIVHELKDKVGAFTHADSAPSRETEAIEALEVLGYATRDTRELVRTLAQEHATTEAIIHKALQQLGGK